MQSYSGPDYWDRYSGDTEHRRKGYTRVLAKPGFAEQASEFNEIQSIQRDYVERLGSSLYAEGKIISGCTLHIDGTSIVISDGQLFLENLIRNVYETELEMTGVGLERVVAKLETSVVTALQDSSLRDPAQGSENYGLEGADRERQVVVLSVVRDGEETEGVAIYTIKDGEKYEVETDADDHSVVTTDVLAERTFDENGSYKVSGLLLKGLPTIDEDTQKVKIHLTEGKAYVRGYAVVRDAMSDILLDQSTSTRSVQSESHYYNSSYTKYELTNGPVAQVNNLTCLVSVIQERKYRGSIRGGYDGLLKTPVDKISRVYTLNPNGTVATLYVQGRDYKLYNDQVDWSLTGDTAIEPPAGTTYYVDYVYNKSMTLDEDFTIQNNADTSYMVFTDSGDRPDENSRMYISYDYTLARRDLILMDKFGEIQILPGQPDKITDLITPYNGNADLLALGYVNIYPTDALSGEVVTGIADIVNYDSVRFTQEDFYTMLQRIETLEDDIAVLDMERSIEEGEDTQSLNGYFTDSFKNINKSDLSYKAIIDGKEISYTACIDYDTEELTTAANIGSVDLSIDNTKSDPYAIYGTVVSAPYTPEIALRQTYATGTMLVNPYASYGPLCKVVLTPDKDNWVDTKTIEVQNTVTKQTYAYDTRTYSHGYWSRDAIWNLTENNYLRTETKTTVSNAGTTYAKQTSSSVAQTLYEYMRVRTITVEGIAFTDGMRNIYCLFNGIPVDIIPASGTSSGSNVTVRGKSVRTVNADVNGYFKGSITIPSKTPCGSVNVTFTGTNSYGEISTGKSIYSAVGTLLTTTITNTTVVTQHYNVLTEIDNLYSADPLAQSFVLDTTNDRVLVKLGLYFATKSPSRPAIVQIRNMVNGYPGETVYAEVTLSPTKVNIPSNPKVPVVTEVLLNQPVYCKAGTYYCFVVLSDSNAYSMYYAEMGKTLLNTTRQLIINPYGAGVMFSSSNASTWTAHQNCDLKFDLYRSRYTGRGSIIFDEASVEDVTGIFLDAAYQDNNNTGIKWYYRYRLSGSEYSGWFPVDTLTFRDLKSITDRVVLKAEIETDFSTSPYIDAGRVSLRTFVDQNEATYISTHLTDADFDEPYQALKISYQAAMPQGADHDVYYMDEMYGSWVKLEASEHVSLETSRVDEEFTQFTWTIDTINCILVGHTHEGSKFFKTRIDLITNLAYNRPRIKKYAAIFKYN